MVFRELLRNTDVIITVSPVPADLAGCLPSSNIPLELSFGNRPILWHVLYPLLDAGATHFFVAVAADWQNSVKSMLEELAAAFRLPKERFCFSLLVLDEADLKSNPVAQVVDYAKHHRSADSMRDFLVVNYDTILSESAVTTFMQGFQVNFASASVLFTERGPRDIETDFICVDDTTPSTQAPAPAAGTIQFAEHRRLHLSEPMPCDPEHELRSNMLMRRPQMVFSKKFCQLPVYLFRPWMAAVLIAHYERAKPKGQQSGGAVAAASSGSTGSSSGGGGGVTNDSVTSTDGAKEEGTVEGGAGGEEGNSKAQRGGGGGGARARADENDDEEEVQLQAKFREDIIPSLLLCQFASFIATRQAAAAASSGSASASKKQKKAGQQLLFRTVTSAQRLREELSLPNSFKGVPVHWCLEQPLTTAKMLRAYQQQVDEINNGAALSSNTIDIAHDLVGEITLDVLNAMNSNLASPHDAVRVFATLCKRNEVAAAASAAGTQQQLQQQQQQQQQSVASLIEAAAVPDIRRVNSAAAYDAASQALRDGLALPPPPVFTSLQKFSIPDLHNGTLQQILHQNKGADNEAPAHLQRCGLLSVPPAGCRVERCIIGRDVRFGEKCNLFDSVIMDGADIGAGATLRRCVVGPRCSVKPDVKHELLVLSWAGRENIGTN